VTEGSVVIMGTDLEVAIQCDIDGVAVHDDGDAILPTARFMQILRTSTGDEVSLEIADGKLHVKCDRSRFALPNEDPALFPDCLPFNAENYMTILGANLKRLIRRTIFAADVESARYALGGAYVEREAERLHFIATDGRRLAKATTDAEWVGGVDGSAQCILPLKALRLIDKATDDGDQIHFAVKTGTSALFRSSNCVISTRLVEGRFPKYSDVFPSESRASIPLDVAAFRSAVEQASITASEESRGVTFKFSADGCELSCRSSDVGQSRVELPLLCGMSDEIEVAMDPQYVVEMLRSLEPTTPLTVDLIDGKNPVLFKSEGDYLYVVMPLTRD
jgi:DNA polymerase-3 subunit beta